jgi:uncharacterized membrane protein
MINKRSAVKAVSWRLLGTLDTIILAFLFTGNADISLGVGGAELVTKTVLYYFHERAWEKK